MKEFRAERLEQFLELWEETCWGNSLITRVMAALQKRQAPVTLPPAHTHWREFRHALLGAVTHDFDQTKFRAPLPFDMNKTSWSFTDTSAWLLHSWCKYSRHVFKLTDELRILLEATSVGNYTWNEILWPFDCFAISFNTPLEYEPGRFSDMFIVGRTPKNTFEPFGKNDGLIIACLPTELAAHEFVSEEARTKYERLLRTGKLGPCKVFTRKFFDEMFTKPVEPRLIYLNFEDCGNQLIKDGLDGQTMHYGGATDFPSLEIVNDCTYQVARLIATVCIYLSSISYEKNESPQHRFYNITPPPVKVHRKELITEETRVCVLTSGITLRPGEQNAIEQALAAERTGSVIPHFRRGHFRKPHGLGNNPEAKRTVLVRPCIVNLRHLPDQTLPGGSHVDLTTPEGVEQARTLLQKKS